MSFHRLISKFGFSWGMGRSHKDDGSGKHLRRRRRLQVPGARAPVTKTEKALLLVVIVTIAALLFRFSMQERPQGIQIVSPEESTFTPRH